AADRRLAQGLHREFYRRALCAGRLWGAGRDRLGSRGARDAGAEARARGGGGSRPVSQGLLGRAPSPRNSAWSSITAASRRPSQLRQPRPVVAGGALRATAAAGVGKRARSTSSA